LEHEKELDESVK